MEREKKKGQRFGVDAETKMGWKRLLRWNKELAATSCYQRYPFEMNHLWLQLTLEGINAQCCASSSFLPSLMWWEERASQLRLPKHVVVFRAGRATAVRLGTRE